MKFALIILTALLFSGCAGMHVSGSVGVGYTFPHHPVYVYPTYQFVPMEGGHCGRLNSCVWY